MPCYTHKMAIVSWPQIVWRHCTLCIRNESVPKIIISDTINFFLKMQSAFWQFQTITVSECCLIKLLMYISFWKMYWYFSVENRQPREPALCQLYRHTFVLSIYRAVIKNITFTAEPRVHTTRVYIVLHYNYCILYIATCKWPLVLCCLIFD